MCTSCFDTLNNFNDVRNFWKENQRKFDDPNRTAEEDVVKVEEQLEEVGTEQFEAMSDSGEQLDSTDGYSVEYIEDEDEPDLIEVETVEESQPKEDVEVKDESLPPRKSSARLKPRKATGENREKGKDIYQKLLKKCAECSKLVEKNRMEGHMNKHRNHRPFVCEDDGCGKAFYCKLLYRLHRTSIHTGQAVPCNVCSKNFPSERSLYAHMLRHKNENRYNCTHCEKKFNNSNSLKRHLAIHSGIREHSCEYCSSSFYRKFNLGENFEGDFISKDLTAMYSTRVA